MNASKKMLKASKAATEEEEVSSCVFGEVCPFGNQCLLIADPSNFPLICLFTQGMHLLRRCSESSSTTTTSFCDKHPTEQGPHTSSPGDLRYAEGPHRHVLGGFLYLTCKLRLCTGREKLDTDTDIDTNLACPDTDTDSDTDS